jgi:serine/threonine protein phosphatase PrpC
MTLVLRYAARSDRGLVRSNNQDSVYAGPRLLALADGMGGHAAGEVASKVVIAALAPLDDDEPGDDLLGQLREATLAGNGAISELVASDPDLDGMGTTLTAVLFSGNRIGLVHVGDSRAYLRRNGQFTQITRDDTFVQSLIDEGRITEDEANNHPQRSLLLRALTGHEVEPGLTVREARAGDRYLLCSDGLSGVVSHETLAEAILIPDPQACADRMIELALKGGGPDNVTVIIADVVDVDYGEDAPIVGGAAGDGSADPPPPDSPASRAGAITAPPPPPEPRPMEAHQEAKDPKAKRGRRIKLILATLVALGLLVGGLFLIRYFVMKNYFVGAAGDGEIAVFQGVPGEVLGVSLNRQIQGSCDPAVPTCDARFVDQLDQAGQQIVRNGGNTYENIDEARQFINRLRTENVLPPCTTPPSSSTPSTSTTPTQPTTQPTQPAPPTQQPGNNGQPPAGLQPPAAPTSTAPTSDTAPTLRAPEPGVDCRPEHNKDGGG